MSASGRTSKTKRNTGQAAPYGQACLQCFKSKCKCVLRSEGGPCERCHRLQKQCEPSEAIRRRKAPRPPRSGPKIAQLEGRIDSLVTLFRGVGEVSGMSAEVRRVLGEQNNTAGVAGGTEAHDDRSAGSPLRRNLADEPALDALRPMDPPSPEQGRTHDAALPRAAPTTRSNGAPEVPAGGLPATSAIPTAAADPDEERCLALFRTHMLPRCPFTHLPADVSAARVKRERPLFFQALCAVAASSRREREDRGQALKRVLAAHMVVDNVVGGMDLLFAILTFVAWSNEFCYKVSGMSRYVMLAMSLVYELGLNAPDKKPAREWFKDRGMDKCKARVVLTADDDKEEEEEEEEPPHGENVVVLERCRAVLGCFILSQCVAAHFQQIDGLQWTPHLGACVDVLDRRRDKASDATLVFQARLHHIAQRAAEIHRQEDGWSPATMLYLTALRDQLWDIKVPSVSNAGRLGFLQAHTWYIELCIWDALEVAPARSPATWRPSSSSSSSWLGPSALPTQRIQQRLWKAVTAVQSHLDILLSLAPVAWAGISLMEVVHITRSFKTIIHLATMTVPTPPTPNKTYSAPAVWDPQAVRDVCDPLRVLDEVIRISDEASVVVGPATGTDGHVFCVLAQNTRGLREWTGAALGEAAAAAATTTTTSQISSLSSPPPSSSSSSAHHHRRGEDRGSGSGSSGGVGGEAAVYADEGSSQVGWAAAAAADSTWALDQGPVLFGSRFTVPYYGFFGTGEWMERIFDEPF